MFYNVSLKEQVLTQTNKVWYARTQKDIGVESVRACVRECGCARASVFVVVAVHKVFAFKGGFLLVCRTFSGLRGEELDIHRFRCQPTPAIRG